MTDQEHIMQFFAYAHLPERLQGISKLFGDAAAKLNAMTPEDIEAERDLLRQHQAAAVTTDLCGEVDTKTPANPEATRAVVKISEAGDMLRDGQPMHEVLRRLLEAKDCAVRALIAK